ncbi:sortilin isoform X2 [Pelobates cultripes]|uniref:Sortilin n=2 Tax=Pelobates cultripes TaxID=61616 RepID=A0AAD1R197_PELCU|nr:sortilin isoform X2 [Pelobates cultripes]
MWPFGDVRAGGLGLYLILVIGLWRVLAGAGAVWPQGAAGSSRERRSAGLVERAAGEEMCSDPGPFHDRLAKDTHTYLFDLSGELTLVWIGDGTGVILVLTTFRIPLFLVTYSQSKLYRSDDYGKTFQEITIQLNDTFVRSEFGMSLGPENSGKVILVGDVPSGSSGGHIFRSSDFANKFIETDLPFHPLLPVSYNPENSNCLFYLSTQYDLWISRNFGESWKNIHQNVCAAKWDSGNTIIFTTSVNESCSSSQTHTMKRTSDFGQIFKVLIDRVFSFGLWGRFLLASVMDEDKINRRIYVSKDKGDKWNMAQLPSVTHEQFYSVLAANDDLMVIHVDDVGDTGYGTIYTSDERGIVYSKSLERHLYTTRGGETDFTNVTSLRGVFIASVLSEDNTVHSVISFDQGGEWTSLRKPENTKCDSTAQDPEKCSLHIHGQYSISQNLQVPMAPLSEPNAVGIIIAHGSVGDAVSVSRPSVYLSDDGGYSWSLVLDGPHHYAILDSGGLIVAVEQSELPISTIKFSTDEGQCWFNYTFTNDSVMFTGLASEPGARSLNVTVWGYRPSYQQRVWVSYTVDFAVLLQKICVEDDYIKWLSHSTDPGAPADGCVLGYKEHYLRLRKSSMCQNGRDYFVNRENTYCTCTLDDYMCDFGYFRKENESECHEQPELRGHELDLCLFGEEEKLTTSGYRKIPGDKCAGGMNPVREEMDLRKKCTNGLEQKSQDGAYSSRIPVILSVVIVLLVAVAAAVLIIKKYICGGRFFVHRYSVLRQHADTQGDEPLDTSITDPRRGGHFHDDSDEDLLE